MAWRAYECGVISRLGNEKSETCSRKGCGKHVCLGSGNTYTDAIIGVQTWSPRTLVVFMPIPVSFKEIGIIHRSPHFEGWRRKIGD